MCEKLSNDSCRSMQVWVCISSLLRMLEKRIGGE